MAQVAQQVKGCTMEPDDLSLTLGIHTVGGKGWFSQIVLWLPRYTVAHTPTPSIHLNKQTENLRTERGTYTYKPSTQEAEREPKIQNQS